MLRLEEARFRVRTGEGERSCILRVTREALLREGVALGLVGVVSPSSSPDGAGEMGRKSEDGMRSESLIRSRGEESTTIEGASISMTETSSAEESPTSTTSDSETITGEEIVVNSSCLALN